MPQIKLFLLGTPRIEVDGSAIEVDTRKATALLVYLAVTGEGHRRDALAALLWPDADQARARAALRRTLSTLNKAMTSEGLRIGREAVGLDPDSETWVDVLKFRALRSQSAAHSHATDDVCSICIVALTEAAEFYRGDFLAGFSLRDSPSFDDWQFRQTESLRRDLADVLQSLIHHHGAAGRYQRPCCTPDAGSPWTPWTNRRIANS